MENGGGGEHRPWIFDQETEDIYRQLVHYRYQMLPYLMQHSETYYNESRSLMDFFNKTDYSYLLGPDLFVAPFLVEGTSITVNFPEGSNWVYLYDNAQVFTGGTQATLTVPYTEYPVFIRQGTYPLAVADRSIPAAMVHIYPNPSEGRFTLTVDRGFSSATLTVLNTLGQTVMTQSLTSFGSAAIDLGHLPKGIYTIRVSDRDDRSVVKRIVLR
jgi:alpha-glucosidase (family GH31 glycosyl hydrolase)